MTLWPVGYSTKTNSPWTAMWHGQRSVGPVFGSRIPFDGTGGTDLSHEALCMLLIRRGIPRYIRGRHKGGYRKGHSASLNNRQKVRCIGSALSGTMVSSRHFSLDRSRVNPPRRVSPFCKEFIMVSFDMMRACMAECSSDTQNTRFGTPGCQGGIDRREYARRGSSIPFSEAFPRSKTGQRPSISRAVPSPMRISPFLARSESRAAILVTWPVAV